MTQGQTVMDFRAKARTDDPIQSFIAADNMNKSGKVWKEWIAILKALKLHGISTAKRLDRIMTMPDEEWDGWAHRRMGELARMGLVHRQEKDENGRPLPQMLCSITEKGKRLLDGI